MFRLLSVPLFLALACVLSGAYGALHNQISYSVSTEYFTEFKFEQFHMPPSLQNRLGAALVGWQASWWMGLIIGFFLIPAGLLVRTNRSYIFVVLRSYFVVFCTTVVCGSMALLTAHLVFQGEPHSELVFRAHTISDPMAFQRAGAMHNFSYLGGLLGIFIGLASILRSFLAENSRLTIQAPDAEKTNTAEND